MICYGPPHPPLVMPERLATLYRPEDMPVRANTTQDADTQSAAREFLAAYYGLVTGVDENVGRVLACLDRSGLAADTIVYLVSDHGEMAYEHGRRGKKVCYDASMRVPLIIRWPRRCPAGRIVRHLVDPSVDTMPTLLTACGLTVPGEVQGVSFAPLLDGTDQPVREAVHYQMLMEKEGPERTPVPERGVRTRQWLYMRTPEDPRMLFDCREDPLEMNNLIDSPAHGEVIRQLDAMVVEHMRRTGDDWAVQAVFPPKDFVTHREGKRIYRRTLGEAIIET